MPVLIAGFYVVVELRAYDNSSRFDRVVSCG